MRRVLLVIAIAVMAAPAMADYYVAGDFNGWDAAGNIMTDYGGGVYAVDLGELVGRHEFKITNGTWDWNYPGPNSWLYGDTMGPTVIVFDTNTYDDGWSPTTLRISVGSDWELSWNVVGSFCGWNNADPAWTMTLGPDMNFSKVAGLAPGHYEFKFVVTGTWDSISWDNRSVNTANWSIDVDEAHPTWGFYLDPVAGVVKVEAVPEPTSLLTLIAGLPLLTVFRKKR